MNVRIIRRRFYRKKGGPYRTVGLRCKEYCAGCIVCDFYRFKDERGRFPRTFDEASAFSLMVQQAEGGDKEKT